jgi:hypothetical protein
MIKKNKIFNIIMNTKKKFISKDNVADYSHSYWKLPQTKMDLIDKESQLLKPIIKSKDKVQIKLNDNFNPNNFELQYFNAFNNNSNNNFYYTNKSTSAGKGFGNLDISNGIRVGGSSRVDSQQFKEDRERRVSFEHQFQYLTRDYQNPDNIVMEFPRGGETTRKQNQLNVNTMRNPTMNNGTIGFDNKEENENKIKFTY